MLKHGFMPSLFQSTPPVKAATSLVVYYYTPVRISIHAAREGGDCTLTICPHTIHTISIHAAREGGDIMAEYPASVSVISIHAAREGGDAFLPQFLPNRSLFQSTPPVKAATP